MDHLPRLQLDEEKGRDRAKEEIRDLQKIASPHLCRMIAQERFPTLPVGSKWRESAPSTSESSVYSPENPV
jgi:hypothetical protein